MPQIIAGLAPPRPFVSILGGRKDPGVPRGPEETAAAAAT